MEMWHFCLFPSDVLMNTELFIVMNVTDCRLLRSRDVIFIFVILASHFSQLYHKKGPDETFLILFWSKNTFIWLFCQADESSLTIHFLVIDVHYKVYFAFLFIQFLYKEKMLHLHYHNPKKRQPFFAIILINTQEFLCFCFILFSENYFLLDLDSASIAQCLHTVPIHPKWKLSYFYVCVHQYTVQWDANI